MERQIGTQENESASPRQTCTQLMMIVSSESPNKHRPLPISHERFYLLLCDYTKLWRRPQPGLPPMPYGVSWDEKCDICLVTHLYRLVLMPGKMLY